MQAKMVKFPGPTRHFRPSCTIAADGSLSTDGCRADPVPVTADSGQKRLWQPIRPARPQYLKWLTTMGAPRKWAKVDQFRRSPTLAGTREVDYFKIKVAFWLLQRQSVNANFQHHRLASIAQLSSRRPATLTHDFARESVRAMQRSQGSTTSFSAPFDAA